MILAMVRVMAMSLMRDRGALAMAFLLPPAIFMIFATIFAGSSGDQLRLQVALGIAEPTPQAIRLETALRADPTLRFLAQTAEQSANVIASVQGGQADVGLLLRGDLARTDVPPIVVYVDPGKLMAGAILAAQVQQTIARHLPDLALSRTTPTIEALVGGFSTQQSAQLTAAIAELSTSPGQSQTPMVEMETIGPAMGSGATVTYYAGAVAILFLLFSAMQGAATLIEDRESGIVDRIAIGPAGTDVVVLGKFWFLTAQGIVQVGLIFLVAALVYKVEILPHIGLWLLTTVISAAAASGLGLVVAAACTSKQQAQTISTFVVLVCSAIGGSMVPRFMMPPWLQDIGWYTPNAWAIEAYHGSLWRGENLIDLVPELSWLLAVAAVGTILAILISRLRLRL